MECRIYLSYVSIKGRSAAGAIVLNPITNKLEKVSCVCENETYLVALIETAIKAIEPIAIRPCDICIICDYIGLNSSIYKTGKYPAPTQRFKSITANHNVTILYAKIRDNELLRRAKELAKLTMKKYCEAVGACTDDIIPDYICYTDGSCNNLSPYGEGGAAYIILDSNGNHIKQNSKGFLGVSNNKMELMAILSAVASVPAGSNLLVRTDSQYCIQVLTNKRNADNFTRPNANVIRQYFVYAARLKSVRFEWVKGHDGNEYNELVDALAQSRTEEMRTIHNIPVYDWRNSPKCARARHAAN